MAVRRLPAARLVIVVLGMCTAAQGDETPTTLPTQVLPPVLLPVPTTTPAKPATPDPCRACPDDYQPSHVFLPDQNPDCCAKGGCDGDCQPCRRGWVDLAFFAGKADNLPYVNRKLLFGFTADAGYWLTGDRCYGLQLGLFSAHGSFREVESGPLLVDSPVTLTAADANVRGELLTDGNVRIDGLAGYRYVRLHEKYLLGMGPLSFARAAENEVQAGQLGVVIASRYGPYFTELLGKMAVGWNEVKLDAAGVRTTDGVLCLVPEIGASCGYQLGEGVWATVGYRAIYLSNVHRPSQGETDYFLHGITVGFEKRF